MSQSQINCFQPLSEDYLKQNNKISSFLKIKRANDLGVFKIFHIENKSKIVTSIKRKYKSDDIRKKIKSRFHKSIKDLLNENLKKIGSKYLFDFLPQCFVSNVTIKLNKEALDLTYKEILLKNFLNEDIFKNYKNKEIDQKKYETNLIVLNYLENNPDISKKSGFDLIANMKYSDLLNQYFESLEFRKSIYKMYNNNEEKEYIKKYIDKAKNFVNFYRTFM